MRHIRLTITGLLIWGLGLPALAQEHAPEEATSYTAEFSGIVGGGDHAPFWAVSNQYGKMMRPSGQSATNTGKCQSRQTTHTSTSGCRITNG